MPHTVTHTAVQMGKVYCLCLRLSRAQCFLHAQTFRLKLRKVVGIGPQSLSAVVSVECKWLVWELWQERRKIPPRIEA
jgi:hypothetical protein